MMWVQGIRQGVEDAEAPVGSGSLRCSRSAICREAHGEGAQGPGAGVGLPYLHAHFLRIWEKQRQPVAPNPTPGETLQTPGRGSHTAWAAHHQLGEWCQKPRIMCENCWSFSAETRDRFQGGMDGGKRFMSVWDRYFLFSVFSVKFKPQNFHFRSTWNVD